MKLTWFLLFVFQHFGGGHWISLDKNHLCRIAYFSIPNNTTCHDVNTCQIQQLRSPEYIFLAARTCKSFAAPGRWQQWRWKKIAKLPLIHLKTKKNKNLQNFQPFPASSTESQHWFQAYDMTCTENKNMVAQSAVGPPNLCRSRRALIGVDLVEFSTWKNNSETVKMTPFYPAILVSFPISEHWKNDVKWSRNLFWSFSKSDWSVLWKPLNWDQNCLASPKLDEQALFCPNTWNSPTCFFRRDKITDFLGDFRSTFYPPPRLGNARTVFFSDRSTMPVAESTKMCPGTGRPRSKRRSPSSRRSTLDSKCFISSGLCAHSRAQFM